MHGFIVITITAAEKCTINLDDVDLDKVSGA